MIEALADGHLGGAFLDVAAVEPLPQESPLWDMPNVVISPHSASTVDAENATLTSLFCDNLRRWLDGAPLRNVYSREKGDQPRQVIAATRTGYCQPKLPNVTTSATRSAS